MLIVLLNNNKTKVTIVDIDSAYFFDHMNKKFLTRQEVEATGIELFEIEGNIENVKNFSYDIIGDEVKVFQEVKNGYQLKE